jgi:cell wall assembly regulator SMI1
MSKKAANVSESWERIERWLVANDAARRIVLPQGATEADVARAERLMGMRLPDDLRESYRRHDGSNEVWLFDQGFILPLGGEDPGNEFMSVVGLWDKMREVGHQLEREDTEVKGPIRDGWWRPGWAPLTEDWSGAFICVDLDPPTQGVIGQVFFFWACYREFLAVSWAALLEQRAAAFESGRYKVTEDGRIGKVDDPD